MAVIDELTILIDADSKGIESTLKKTLQIVTGTVGQMNKQEVDWTSIFTRAVSPALIGGIASMFAFAIGQSLQFQQAMNTTGTAAGESSLQIAQTGQAALGMADNTGQSAQNIANAMLQVSSIFGVNTDATNEVTQALTQLSDSGFGSLNDIVSATIPLFKEFGVTTSQQAVAMLTSLMHGAEASKESIATLAGQFGQFSPALVAAGANVSSFNGLISDFAGRIQSLGLANAQAVFQAIADSAMKPTGPFELLGQNIKKVQDSIQSGDLTGLVDNLSKKLQSMGNISQLVATNMGLSADQVTQFQISAKNLSKTDTDIKNVATSTQTIGDAWNQSDTAVREFTRLWNNLVDIMVSGPIGNFLTAFAKGLADDAESLKGLINGVAGSNLYDLLHPTEGNGGNVLGVSAKTIGNIVDTGGADLSALTQAIVKLFSATGGGSNYSSAVLKNTFNLTIPSGSSAFQIGSQVASQLYKLFQGTGQ